ncbi:MAG: hypothetical protein IJY81_07200 [Lachnospiraceae bacterium]|nr:hypothetical protein [Lachnospiraceae bacterium]
MEKILKRLELTVMVISVIMIIVSFTSLVNSVKLVNTASSFVGTVSSIGESGIYVTYVYNDKLYENVHLDTGALWRDEGDTIRLYYDETKLQPIRDNVILWVVPLMLLVFGALLLFGIGKLYLQQIEVDIEYALAEKGKRINAIVNHIGYNAKKGKYFIECSYTAENGKIYVFNSRLLDKSYDDIYFPGDSINVLVNKKNYRIYLVDQDKKYLKKVIYC